MIRITQLISNKSYQINKYNASLNNFNGFQHKLMKSIDDLRRCLARIDGRGYKAYKDIKGEYNCGALTLCIDHVQGDPFAIPSMIRVRAAQEAANLPEKLFNNAIRRMAFEDFLARKVAAAIHKTNLRIQGSGKSGLIYIDAGAQESLERSAAVITRQWVEVRMQAGLPANGRTILGKQAELMLCDELPKIVQTGILWQNLPESEAEYFVNCVENQEHMRSQLDKNGLAAFVAAGSILPRKSGVDDRPMTGANVESFKSPDKFRVELDIVNPVCGANGEANSAISGMGIPKGVTLIVGGGYHGKSTLLKALEHCVYPHIPGDGREFIATCRDAVKIRAEEGRRIERVNISPFINNLPRNQNTTAFITENASGSTSQAANIIEAIEIGASVILLDEDTSATNFMVRDARMQELVKKEREPITPFIDRARELYDNFNISTIIVMGGCGDYFDVADNVIMMSDYKPIDATKEAKEIAANHLTSRRKETGSIKLEKSSRTPIAKSFDPSRGRKDVKIDAKTKDLIIFGSNEIDLRHIDQLLDHSQTRAVAQSIYIAATQLMDGKTTLCEIVNSLEQIFNEKGVDALNPFSQNEEHPGNFARPRKYEIAAAINRLRTMKME